VYSRTVDGQARRFGVTGELWHGVLVMFDRATESHWTQLDGRAIQGPLRGDTLEHVPSVFTTFGQWTLEHPDTLVLVKSDAEREQKGSKHADYFANPSRLFFERLGQGLDTSVIRPKDVVFGVRGEGDAVAVTESTLERVRVLPLEVGGKPVALLRDTVTGDVRAVSRSIDGKTRDLVPVEGHQATERVADAATGEEFEVDALEPLRVDRAYWYAWARTVPGARAYAD